MSKPIMVKIKSEKDGYITLKEEELKKIIDVAYNMGYNEGSKLWTYQPSITSNPYNGNQIYYTADTTTSTTGEVTNETTNS
jgi:hypothetical protein